jgi:hypothetical protein
MDQTHRASAQSSHANGAAQVPLSDNFWWPAMPAWLTERLGPALPVRTVEPAAMFADACVDYVMVCDAG